MKTKDQEKKLSIFLRRIHRECSFIQFYSRNKKIFNRQSMIYPFFLDAIAYYEYNAKHMGIGISLLATF